MKIIKGVMCEPYKLAREIEVNADYNSLCKEIGGNVAVFELISDKVVILYDDEGKMNGSDLCRAIYQEDKLTDFKPTPKHRLIDIIANKFIVCGMNEGDFVSLTDKQIKQYMNLYKYPEVFDPDELGVNIMRIKDGTFDFRRVLWRDMK